MISSKSFCLFVVAASMAASTFAEQERVVRVQNFLRFGYDDNIYQDSDDEGSAVIRDSLNISANMTFSGRTDAVLSYQPEVRYRFDADPKAISLHDAYGKLNHAMSERVFLTLSDRLRYQDRDAQEGDVSKTDANYLDNSLLGSLAFTLSEVSSLNIGGGYGLRVWDDDAYGKDAGNNFDEYKANLSLFRELKKDTTKGMVGVDFTSTEYDGSRGSLDVTTLMTGADHEFNASATGFGRVGVSSSSVDTTAGSEDSTTPYLSAGMDYAATEQTSFNGNISYSAYRAQNSYYNSQDQMKLGFGVRHDVTAKISVVGTASYIMSEYDADFGTVAADADDEWLQFSLRGTYAIDRNNAVELGYEFTDRSTDVTGTSDFDRNRIELGWRLSL
jgi:hypothetical protein